MKNIEKFKILRQVIIDKFSWKITWEECVKIFKKMLKTNAWDI